MNRGYIAGCCLIVAAAIAGYGIFSDRLPADRPPPPTLGPAPDSGIANGDQPQIFAARQTGEIIDLGRVYEPTGEELDLHNLLYGQPVVEAGPAPREADPEFAPLPREAERELLHAPRLVAEGEADSSPAVQLPCHGPFTWILSALLVEWMTRSLTLNGTAW